MSKRLSILFFMVVFSLFSFSLVFAEDINILAESGGVGELKTIAENWQKETGNTVNFIEVPYADVYNKFAAEMAAKGSDYDVVVTDVVWMPAFADFAEPIDDLFTDEVKSDMFPFLLKDTQYNGHYIGMPAWANTELLYYRKDLFENEKEKSDFKAKYGYDLSVPTTWQQYIDTAQFFTRDTDGDGEIDLFGTDVKGVYPEEWEAFVFQAGSPYLVLDDNGNLVVDDQYHVKALQTYADLHCKYNVTPKNVNEIDWNASQQMFQDGKLAMELFWAHGYRMIPKESPVYGKTGIAPMPAGDGGIAGVPGPWYNIIPSTSKKIDLAKEFVAYAFKNNVVAIENSPLALVASISAMNAYKDKPGYEYLNAMMETLNSPLTGSRPRVSNWQEITDEVLTPLVQKALTCDGTPIEDLVKEAKSQLEEMKK